MTTNSKALLALAGAFAIWGAFPIFVRWMSAMRADELLYVRIAFSFFLLTGLYVWRGELNRVWTDICRPVFLLRCCITAIFIAMNWYLYIVAVNLDQTTQASIGYFITPLINAMFGVWLFGEKLDRWKITALAFGCAGVLYQMAALGIMPWLALGIGGAFGIYGSLRKKMQMPPVRGMYAELLVLMPIVVLLWAKLAADGHNYPYLNHPSMIIMCIVAGIVTLVPLLLFLYAVQHLTLTTVGFAQYSTPTLQFLVAIFYFHEPFNTQRLIAFLLIWIGLGIYSVRLIQQNRSKTR